MSDQQQFEVGQRVFCPRQGAFADILSIIGGSARVCIEYIEEEVEHDYITLPLSELQVIAPRALELRERLTDALERLNQNEALTPPEAVSLIEFATEGVAAINAENLALQQRVDTLQRYVDVLEQAHALAQSIQAENAALRAQAQAGRMLLALIDAYGWLDDLERDAAKSGECNRVFEEVRAEIEQQWQVLRGGSAWDGLGR